MNTLSQRGNARKILPLALAALTSLSPTHSGAREDEPGLVALPTPVIANAQIIDAGEMVVLHLQWQPVPGARAYFVDVSPSIRFNKPFLRQRIKTTVYRTPPLRAGIYFVRLRAGGAVGPSAYSKVKMIDASGLDPSQRAASAGGRGGYAFPASPSDATAGAEPPQPPPPPPLLPFTARPGAATGTVDEREATRAALAPTARKLQDLKAQLDDIARLRAKIEQTVRKLREDAATPEVTSTLKDLLAELEKTKNAQKQLESEIDAAVAAINRAVANP